MTQSFLSALNQTSGCEQEDIDYIYNFLMICTMCILFLFIDDFLFAAEQYISSPIVHWNIYFAFGFSI